MSGKNGPILRLMCFLTFLFVPGLFAAESSLKDDGILTVVHLDSEYYNSIGGYPPPDRNAYLSIIDRIKDHNPRIVFFDLSFVRKPFKSEKNFATRLNARLKIIIPFFLSAEQRQENFATNQAYWGQQIAAVKLPAKMFQDSLPGIFLPYPEMVAESMKVCVDGANTEEDRIVRAFYTHYYYKDHLLPTAALCIVNNYLVDKNMQLVLGANGQDLRLIEQTSGKWKLKKIIANILEANEEKPIPINFAEIKTVRASDIQSQSAAMFKGKIVFVGAAADGIGNWAYTPKGRMLAIDVLAHEVNTLWNMIKDDIPVSSP